MVRSWRGGILEKGLSNLFDSITISFTMSTLPLEGKENFVCHKPKRKKEIEQRDYVAYMVFLSTTND